MLLYVPDNCSRCGVTKNERVNKQLRQMRGHTLIRACTINNGWTKQNFIAPKLMSAFVGKAAFRRGGAKRLPMAKSARPRVDEQRTDKTF
jgi:hypothetical protein